MTDQPYVVFLSPAEYDELVAVLTREVALTEVEETPEHADLIHRILAQCRAATQQPAPAA